SNFSAALRFRLSTVHSVADRASPSSVAVTMSCWPFSHPDLRIKRRNSSFTTDRLCSMMFRAAFMNTLGFGRPPAPHLVETDRRLADRYVRRFLLIPSNLHASDSLSVVPRWCVVNPFVYWR